MWPVRCDRSFSCCSAQQYCLTRSEFLCSSQIFASIVTFISPFEAERKKAEAMAARERSDYVPPPKKLSKAELKAQAEYKAKHKRMAKTGPAKKKYDGEGSAVQKAKKGGGKKKKKG